MAQKCVSTQGSLRAKLNVKQTTGAGSELNNISNMQFQMQNCSKQHVPVVILIACHYICTTVQ